MSPVQVMKEFYSCGRSVAFRQKNTEDKIWYYTPKPIWNWGLCDYKVIDLQKDEYNLM